MVTQIADLESSLSTCVDEGKRDPEKAFFA